jgi:hypothetical protein
VHGVKPKRTVARVCPTVVIDALFNRGMAVAQEPVFVDAHQAQQQLCGVMVVVSP